MTLPLASAENWTMCDPHELFLERAARVEPGGERAFIEAQIDAFSDRAHWLEQESRCWHRDAPPVRKGKEARPGGYTPPRRFRRGACRGLPRLCPGAGERIGVAGPSGEKVRSVWGTSGTSRALPINSAGGKDQWKRINYSLSTKKTA